MASAARFPIAGLSRNQQVQLTELPGRLSAMAGETASLTAKESLIQLAGAPALAARLAEEKSREALNPLVSMTEGSDANDRGFINLPKVGKLHVAGMTQEQMLEEIDSAYIRRRFVTPPYQPRSVFYYTKGEVKQPGRQLYLSRITLTKAVEFGWGFTAAAIISKVIIRRDTGSVEHYDCRRIMKGLQTDPEVRPNDIIEVRRRFLW